MKGGMFGSGPVHANGTRVFHDPVPASKAEAPTGKASASHLGPPLPAWMADPRRKCKDQPTRWWYAPQTEHIELRDEQGKIVLNEEGRAVIARTVKFSTEADAKAAEAICATCPLNLECREYGLRHEPCGIWGGVRLDNVKLSRRGKLLAEVERKKHEREQRRWSA